MKNIHILHQYLPIQVLKHCHLVLLNIENDIIEEIYFNGNLRIKNKQLSSLIESKINFYLSLGNGILNHKENKL